MLHKYSSFRNCFVVDDVDDVDDDDDNDKVNIKTQGQEGSWVTIGPPGLYSKTLSVYKYTGIT